MGPEVAEIVAAHPSRPVLIESSSAETPWQIPPETEILITHASKAWRDAPARKPADFPAKLSWVQTMSAGVEVFPAWLPGTVPMSTGRGIAAVAIAEYVLAAILRLEKRLDRIGADSPADWTRPTLGRLAGKTLGLIGYGAIGQAVAKRARAFDMRVVACRSAPWDGDALTTGLDTPEMVAAVADHLVIAMPLTPASEGLVDARFLERAKPGLHLINVSRGKIVDQEALVRALDAGQVSAATLDVTTPEPLTEGHPLYRRKDVLVTPHISWSGAAMDAGLAAKVCAGLDALLAGQTPVDLIDVERGW